MHADLILYNAGQLVTCASGGGPKRRTEMQDVGIIENGAVAVTDGKIVAVGSSVDILRDYSADEMIDAEERVVTPGFVDPHTHIVFAGDRLNEFEQKLRGDDYLAIMKYGGGINATVKHTREASVDELVELGLKRLDKMLACGTTVCEIKTGYGLDTATEMKMLEAIERLDAEHPIDIVPTFLGAHAVPLGYAGKTDAYVDIVCEEMLPLAWEWYEKSRFLGKRDFYADVFCEVLAFDLEQSVRVLTKAEQLGFRLKGHVDEFSNRGGSGKLIEMGAVSIDHLDNISDSEIEQLAASDTIGIITPTVNFNLGAAQFANARKLIDTGCAVAISTDYNPGSAPCPSQPMTMALACRYQRLLPAEVMNAGTINAAYSIGLGKTHGSIDVGKRADILIHDATDYRQISYEFGATKIDRIFVAGRCI